MDCCNSEETEETETETRSCTDVFWLVLYIAFWVLMVLIAAFAFVYGNPLRIVNGYDSFGNTCGTRNNKKVGNLELSGIDTSDKPFLIFYDVKELKHSLKVCVKECPKRTLNTLQEIAAYKTQTGTSFCRYDFNYNDLNNQSIHTNALSDPFGPCPVLPVYEGTPVLNRCVPKPVKDLAEGVLSGFYDLLNSWDTLEQILGDLYHTWGSILGLTFFSLILSLLTVAVLHLLASLVSYILLILVTVTSVAGSGFLWYTYYDLSHTHKMSKIPLLDEALKNESAFFWFAIVATIITVVIVFLAIVMRKHVDFLANLFKETSKCLVHIPGLFLQPLITFTILLAFFAFWVLVVLCLATSYYPGTTGVSILVPTNATYTSRQSSSPDLNPRGDIKLTDVKKFTVVEFVDPMWIKYMWWVYFLGLVWTSEFIMACQQMVIAGAVAHWFYRNKYKGDSHITYAICKLIKYHLGSVALGSLIITAFKTPRLILTYLHERLEWNKGKGSECAKCGLKCCICCFYCLEKFIKYLNHNAYTVIAIDGSSFCPAAATAFQVLTSHALQVATINGVGDLILFLGKCFVTALTGIVGLYFFRADARLTFYAAPTLLVCIFAFFVAHCVLSLYEMVLDTIYLCMCQDADAPEAIHLENLQMPPPQPPNNGNAAGETMPMK